jgi:hypothetical protein
MGGTYKAKHGAAHDKGGTAPASDYIGKHRQSELADAVQNAQEAAKAENAAKHPNQ